MSFKTDRQMYLCVGPPADSRRHSNIYFELGFSLDFWPLQEKDVTLDFKVEIAVKSRALLLHRVYTDAMNIHNCLAIVLVLGIITSSQVSGALAANVLVSMDGYSVLNSYEYLSILDKYYLVMQPDCDLILYNQSGLPLKHTDSSRESADGSLFNLNCSLWMQSDGNCVIYNLTTADWLNHSLNGNPSIPWAESGYSDPQWNASFLLLGGDGSLDFYTPNATLRQNRLTNLTVVDVNASSPVNYPKFDPNNSTYSAWEPGVSLDEYPYMPAEYFLSAGKRLQTLSSPGFALELNAGDCNLQSQQLLYAGGTQTLWNSSTTGSLQNHTCQLELLQNGTLQVRDLNSNELYWKSGTSGDSTVSWILKLDPNNGTLSVSDITNSSNLLWTNAPNSLSPSPQPIPKSTSDQSIVWIVVGVIVGAFVMAMAALGLYFYARDRFLDPADRAFQKRLRANGGYSQALSQAKIKQATKNYQTVIGRGGFGDVFYGQLPDGQEVAAKVLSVNSRQSKQEFYNEIELLSKVHHKYLVSLLGYSSTRSHQVLIYEYMGGGDLRHRLHERSEGGVPLSWRERTNIMLQVAEGLEYLHGKCSPPIIHRDIKSTNILLTTNLVAKVADFGLSKLKAIGQEDATHVTTVVKGTPGYLDPEYHETGLLTEKSDVYAFGVVLMEIFTGQHHVLIANRVGEAWRQQQFHDLADPQLGGDFDRNELSSLVELALWCVRRSNLERPLMRQVVRRLHELLLVPSESSRPNIDLGEEEGRYAPVDIELMMIDSSGDLSIEATPLNTGSSSSVASREVPYHPGQIQYPRSRF